VIGCVDWLMSEERMRRRVMRWRFGQIINA
jgi:hypothetical protein